MSDGINLSEPASYAIPNFILGAFLTESEASAIAGQIHDAISGNNSQAPAELVEQPTEPAKTDEVVDYSCWSGGDYSWVQTYTSSEEAPAKSRPSSRTLVTSSQDESNVSGRALLAGTSFFFGMLFFLMFQAEQSLLRLVPLGLSFLLGIVIPAMCWLVGDPQTSKQNTSYSRPTQVAKEDTGVDVVILLEVGLGAALVGLLGSMAVLAYFWVTTPGFALVW